MLLQLFVDNTRPAMPKTSLDFVFFYEADKHSGCYGNGLIDVAEKFEFGACSI